MPRTKGSKNRAKTGFDAQIAKLQKDKALFPNGFRRRKFALNEFKEDGMRNAESIS